MLCNGWSQSASTQFIERADIRTFCITLRRISLILRTNYLCALKFIIIVCCASDHDSAAYCKIIGNIVHYPQIMQLLILNYNEYKYIRIKLQVLNQIYIYGFPKDIRYTVHIAFLDAFPKFAILWYKLNTFRLPILHLHNIILTLLFFFKWNWVSKSGRIREPFGPLTTDFQLI